MSASSPSLRIEPGDRERLARQAQDLARPSDEAAGVTSEELVVVTFCLGGSPFAVEAHAIDRAVARLGAMVAVARGARGQRLVAWIDEQPVAVTDLGAWAGLAARPAAALARAPALLVERAGRAVAFAVEGPLRLAEEHLVQVAGAALEGATGLPLAGRLAGGAGLLAPSWTSAGEADA